MWIEIVKNVQSVASAEQVALEEVGIGVAGPAQTQDPRGEIIDRQPPPPLAPVLEELKEGSHLGVQIHWDWKRKQNPPWENELDHEQRDPRKKQTQNSLPK